MVMARPLRIDRAGEWYHVLGKPEQAAVKKGLKGQPAKEEIQRRLERLRQYRWSWGQIVEVVDRLKGERWEEYMERHGDWGRELAMYLGRRWGRMKLREIGRAVGGADYAAVSAAVVRFGRRLPREPFLEKQLAAATRELNIEC